MSTTTESDVNDGSANLPVADSEGEGVITPKDSGTPGPRGPATEPVPVPTKPVPKKN
jgi:hypothetical protein